MPFTRPSVYPDWATSGTRTNPGSPAIAQGYVPDFVPPAEWHNWQFGYAGDWIRWLDQQVQQNYANVEFDAIVGTGGTYPDINSMIAAIQAGTVITKVLVSTLQTLAVTQVIPAGIADLELVFKPQAFYSKGISSTPGLQIDGQRITVRGGRWLSFSGVSDVAILLSATSRNCRIKDINFNSCTTAISDLGTGNELSGNIEEV